MFDAYVDGNSSATRTPKWVVVVGSILAFLAILLAASWIFYRVNSDDFEEITTFTSKFKDGKITFVAVGDWGDDTAPGQLRQRHVAAIMDSWCSEHSCDFIMSTGDNFYPDGTLSKDDIRYNTSWRDVYTGPAIINLTWFMSLGNNDHRKGHEINQLRFAENEERFHMPWYYYGFQIKDKNTSALFYAMDTEAINKNKLNPEAQIADMKDKFSRTEANWKIAFGHHPPLSTGKRWGNRAMFSKVMPILDEYAADAMFNGHEHNMQHIIRSGQPGMDFVVSGGGGGVSYHYNEANEIAINELGYDSLYFEETYGFVGVTISDIEMAVDYYGYTLENNLPKIRQLYSFKRIKQ